MPSRPIAHHAGSFRGTFPPVLPFLAPRALEQPTATSHVRRCMTSDVAASQRGRHAGLPRATHAWESNTGASRAWNQASLGIRAANRSASLRSRRQACCVDSDCARTQGFPRRTLERSLPTFVTSQGPPRSRLRPQYSEIWAFFNRQARRSYSTSDDDYMVEEDEEKAILEGRDYPGPPLSVEELMHLMNPDFRALRRFLFLSSSQEHSTKNIKQLLEKAKTFPVLDDFPQQDIWWIKKFAQLNAPYDARLPLALRSSRLEINASTEQAVKLLFRRGRHAESIRETWIADMRDHYSFEGKRNIWCEIMLWLLHHDQDAVLPTLVAIGKGHKAPPYVVADILEHLMSHHLQHTLVGQESLPAGLLPALTFLLDQKPYLARALSQKFFHLTLVHSTLAEGKELWETLRNHGFRPTWHTYYHLGYFLGGHGDYEGALEALRRPIELGAPPTHWAFLATCARVLRNVAANAEHYHASSDILSKFVEMGVPLNIYLYTIVMHNAVDRGDMRTALNVFQLLRVKDIEPNDYTYSVLLKGLKDGQNPEALQELIKEAGQALPKLERPHVVATDIIHCIYLNHFEPHPTNRTFADLAQAYHEYFDPSPLVRLGVPAQFFGNPEALTRMGITPSPPPIGIILAAYLELISENSPEEVVRLYRIFRHQIERSGEPILSELGGLNYYYNAFLLAMGQNANTLGLMPEVLRQMTDKRVHSVPLASEHTWDILVNAFMRHNQPEAAKRVMQTMSAYGQKPNEVTWNSLVKGYGRLQDVDNVLATIRDMQLQKVQLGDFSLRVLGRMKEGDKLSKGLREMEKTRRRHLEEEQDYLVPEDYQEGSNNGQKSEEEMWEAIIREQEEESNWRDGKSMLDTIEKTGRGTGKDML